jgi:7-cyano-7-deazaguanine synthase
MVKTGLLLSGGMDSVALAFWRRPDVAFTVDYGQLAAKGEIRAARQIAKELDVAHEVLAIDCRQLGSGDMAGIPASAIAPVPEWWPFRNQMLVTFAAARAVSLGVGQLLVGSVASDESHQDGKAEFYVLLDRLLEFQEGGIRVTAPGIAMTTEELVRTSGISLSQLSWAHSCHKGEFACGDCRGCYKYHSVMELLEAMQ